MFYIFVTFWSFILCIIYGLCALWVCTAFVGRPKGNLNLEKMLSVQQFSNSSWYFASIRTRRVFLVHIAKLATKTRTLCSSQHFPVQVGNRAAWQREGKESGRGRRRGSQGCIFPHLFEKYAPLKDPEKEMVRTLSSPPTSSASSLLSS